MKRIFAVLTFVALAGSACDDPTAPLPVEPEQFSLELRDVYLYENGAPSSQVVEFTAAVSDAVPAAMLDSIEAMEVKWPNQVVRMPIPVTFHSRADTQWVASFQTPREQGLFTGTYTLTLRFKDGRETSVERLYNTARRIGPASNLRFHREPTWATLNWSAPSVTHDWSVRLERWDPEPVDTLVIGPGGSAGRGALGAGFDYAFETGVTYAFILELSNEYTVRRYAYTWVGE
jgi:hypothetical protein